MNASKLAVKFFIADDADIDALQLVPVFHRWIQENLAPDHVLIDVADYTHVVNGPGVVLVSHEANFSFDSGGGRLGLLYNRKRPADGSFRDHLRVTFASALHACVQLERDLPGKISFVTSDFLFRVYDRLLAPNTPETFSAMKGEFEAFLKPLFAPATFRQNADPENLFELRVSAPSAPAIKNILDRLG
jgi:hypothetical protein